MLLVSSAWCSRPGSVTFGSLTGKPNCTGPLLPQVWENGESGRNKESRRRRRALTEFRPSPTRAPQAGPALPFPPDSWRLSRGDLAGEVLDPTLDAGSSLLTSS
ncbi:uncharacterized protein LOC144237442 [Crocuta crocuta]